jgi:predicted dehydrogenase
MTESRLGIGVVGINPRIRRTVIAGIAASRRARLAAVCSRDAAKAEGIATEHRCAAYDSFEAMLADPSVEAVFICTPHHLHHPMSLAALAAGKRVTCEKPLALTLTEAEELAAAASRIGLPTVVNFTYHSLPGQRLVARLLESGEIGRLRHLDLTYWQARDALPDAKHGDALLEIGSHEVDLALWWSELGGAGAIRTVVCEEDQRPGEDASAWTPILMAMGRTEGGALVSLQANRVAAGWRNGMVCRLVGDSGALTLTFDTDQTEVRLARLGDGSPEGVARPVVIPADLAVSYQDFPGFHVDRLVAALQGDGQFPDFAYGLRCQRLLGALRRSACEHRWVDVDA